MPSMSYISFRTTLAAPVAVGGSFVIKYPNGTTQNSFDSDGNHILRVDGYNKDYRSQANEFAIAFNPTEISITNQTGINPISRGITLQLDTASDMSSAEEILVVTNTGEKLFVKRDEFSFGGSGGGGGGAVDSVNGQTGVVVLTAANVGAAATTHSHAISDVTNLQTSLNGKAATSHTHSISDVTNLQTSLNGKAAASHTHAIADVTNLQTSLDAKAGTAVFTSTANGLTPLSGGGTANFLRADGTWAQPPTGGGEGGGAVDSVNGYTGTVVLSASDVGAAATSHTHVIADTTGLQAALDSKQAAGSYADASHTHAISDVTNLQTSLDGKAATSHTHAISDVTNLQTSLDAKIANNSGDSVVVQTIRAMSQAAYDALGSYDANTLYFIV